MLEASSICLSMIVKDESEIIINTLKNIIDKINITFIIICDTGSTDNTISIINDFLNSEYCISKNIKGEVHQNKWVDFSYNRNIALKLAKDKTDYTLIFDADNKLVGNFKDQKLVDDMYYFQIKSGVSFYRPILVSNKKDFEWYGVLHEFLSEKKINNETFTKNYIPESVIYVEDNRLGNRSKNKYKYLDDAKILLNEINKYENECKLQNLNNIEKFLYCRYIFYCAKSFRDYAIINKENNLEYIDKSIYYFNKFLKLNINQNQEKYLSCFYIWKQKENSDLLYILFESIKYDNERIETVCELMKYFIDNKNYLFAKYLYYNFKNYRNIDLKNKLFINNAYYNGYFEYLYSLCGIHVDDLLEGIKCCKYCIENNFKTDISKQNLIIYALKYF